MAKQIEKILMVIAAVQWLGAAVAQEHHHHHHHRFAADVDAFHSVLAPVWHAAPGKERLRDACAKASRMEALAKDIRSTDASELRGSIAVLKGKCKGGSADVDGAFHEVHEAFHRLIEPGPGK